MRTPVARVANEGQLLSALPALDEEGAASDRPARLRIVDRVRPDRLQVLAEERMPRQDLAEQEASPVCEARAEDDSDRLRVEGADAADLRQVGVSGVGTVLADRAMGEDEVLRADLHAVAPVGFGADVVRQREGGFLVNSTRETRSGRSV